MHKKLIVLDFVMISLMYFAMYFENYAFVSLSSYTEILTDWAKKKYVFKTHVFSISLTVKFTVS